MKVSGEKWGADLYFCAPKYDFPLQQEKSQKINLLLLYFIDWNNLIQTNWCKWVIRGSLISILTKSGLSIIESGMQWKNSLMKYFIIPVNYNTVNKNATSTTS